MPTPAISDPVVAKMFSKLPEQYQNCLMKLRELIFETADATEGVLKVTECLKWGQPSYVAEPNGIGSTIRLGQEGDKAAIYFICSTNLVETFKAWYPERFHYAGNRAILIGLNEPLPENELSHCIAMALTYHKRKSTP